MLKQLLYDGIIIGDVVEGIEIVTKMSFLVIETLLKSENPVGHVPPGIANIKPTSPDVVPLLGKIRGLLKIIISGTLTT